MFKLRMGKTYNMGNFTSEKVELEREFPDDTRVEATSVQLSEEVEKAHIASHLDKAAIRAALDNMNR